MPKLTGPVVFALAVSSWGCASVPSGHAAIDSVEIVGVRSLDPGEVMARLATEESPKFLGLFRGFANDYTIYDASVLQRDLARVERYYRGRGFFEAHARVGRVEYVSANHVRVQIVVDEGAPVRNADVHVEGIDTVPAAIAGTVRKTAVEALPRGERFDEDKFKSAQTHVLQALTDHGYAYATVQATAQVDLASHTIDYAFRVTPGITAVYGAITFVGLDPDGAGPEPQEIDESILRRVMHIRPGAPYSTAELSTATQALLDLEVFSAAHIVPALSDPTQPIVPLVVQLEPTKLRALRLGGGAELDSIKTDVHVIVGWEDHNLLGNLRDLSVDFSPGLVFYPTSISTLTNGDGKPTNFFPEERLRVQLRQPGFLEPRTTGFVRPEFNVYPLLVDPNPSANINVTGYVEPKVSLGVERRFGKHLFVTLAYNLQGEVPFWYKEVPCNSETMTSCPTRPPAILLSFPQLTAQLDFRDSASHPHSGFQINIDLQAASLPGTAQDVRLQPDVEGYIPIARGVTFAMTGALGMLFPFNYGLKLPTQFPPAGSTLASPTALDVETVYFRGFFSGGPSSNRGYPLRGVAPHGYVPFLNPATASAQVANGCDPNVTTSSNTMGMMSSNTVGPNPVNCLSPIGGFTMWQASAELRVDVSGPLGLATFCDAGDVSQFSLPSLSAIRFNYLHMSCGAGARYDTPVGPIRLDFAYRIPSLQIVGSPSEEAAFQRDITFGVPPRLGGTGRYSIPAAIAFGIGEAF
jgi:outer membrane protein assembly factor BamA